MTDITTIKRMLADRAQSVAEMLLPGGRKEGAEWRAGSVNGEKGQSLGVHLSGQKAGIWQDFATGEGGDLLDLYMAAKGSSLTDALEWARGFLGVTRPAPYREPAKSYQRPPKPDCKPAQGVVLDYLTEVRNIPRDIIAAYKVAARGDEIIFPYLLPDGVLALAKARKAEDGASPRPTAANCEPVLFGWQAIPENAREIVITEGECLLGTTEVLTPTGWTSLEAYRGERVAQWEDGQLQWVSPVAKIEKPYSGELISFKGHLVTMTVTPGHRMPGVDRNGRVSVLTGAERETGKCRHHRLPRSGVMSGNGIGLSKDQLAFCLAVSADAAIDIRKQSYAGGVARRCAAEDRYARITLFRSRKIERITGLLNRLGLTHTRTEGQCNPRQDDGVFFGIPLPDWVPGRILPWEWIELATEDEREFLIDELRHWDGNAVIGRNQYEFSTKHSELADWVQALCHTSGRCSTIMRRANDYGEWLKVSILNGKADGSYQTLKPERVHHNGHVYCLTVPSGMFLARENGRVFVTGNCDALSWAAYGYPALSVPFGGGKGGKQNWIEAEYDRLERFERIYISTDMDKPGEEAAEEIASRLGRHRCFRVSLKHKDANECLMSGLGTFAMAEAIKNAQSLDPEGLRRATDFTDDVIRLFWPAHEEHVGYSTPYKKLGDKMLFRPAEVTLWSGASGMGKSQILSDCVPHWIKEGSRVCLASFEMKCSQTLKRMCKQTGGVDRPTAQFVQRIVEWLDQGLLLYEKVGKSGVEPLLEIFEYARAKYGCDQFIIDSLMRLGIAGDDYTGQEKAMFRIVDWAISRNVHVHLVAHARKGERGQGAPETEDIKGAMEIGANAFNILTVWRDRKQEETVKAAEAAGTQADVEDRPGVLLNVAKQRNGDFEGKIGLWFDQATYRYYSSYDRSMWGRHYVSMAEAA